MYHINTQGQIYVGDEQEGSRPATEAEILENQQKGEKTARIMQIERDLREIDEKSARALRAVATGTATEDDTAWITALEQLAWDLRQEWHLLGGTVTESRIAMLIADTLTAIRDGKQGAL